jgi:RHH-type proline utilization regulon transcriptional repressor/proline dehydrogenase/delta 1-pyrroline-5-carboxylate dehydrogenase
MTTAGPTEPPERYPDGVAGRGIDAAVGTAVALARRWAGASEAVSAHSARLAALVSDPVGLDLAVRFIDRVVRPEDVAVAGRELGRLRAADVPRGVLGPVDRALFALGTRLGPVFPSVVVPAARTRLRGLVGHLVADLGQLGPHIERLRSQGFRLNLNLLGEAVLGETEATARLMRIQTLAARRDVDNVSVKVSGLASQLSPWDPTALERLLMRLRLLARSAAWDGTTITLDMEEYRDHELTVRVFAALLAEPELAQAGLGIAIQAYLPDSLDALDVITEHAIRRVESGGLPAKVRLVKGANLPMERVEAILHGWQQAPYETKAEVDANYVRLLDRALTPRRARALRVGVASHNLFHVALAHVVATDRGLADSVDVEMLQGMAPAQAAAVRDDVGGVLLYTPVVARRDFDLAVAYLVRRLEESASHDNFLPAVLAGGQSAIDEQERQFRASVEDRDTPGTRPRRRLRPESGATGGWCNEPDTDPADPVAQGWATGLLGRAVKAPIREVATAGDVDDVVARAVRAAPGWAATPPTERARLLRSVAEHLRVRREDLLAVMSQEGAKTIAEADPEVSEAVDFATYYAERAGELPDGSVPGARFRPSGITVVTPPWNFPVAIPLGSALAALAAGSAVILKPAPQTPQCAAVAMAAVHAALDDAGISRDVAQIVDPVEGDLGRRLVSHPDVQRVLLTGSIETARAFAGWRPGLDVIAETSGKNAIVVTPSADVDLAVADVVRSAFGHAGQKCSAASLLILVGSAGRSARLRRQLADAVGSLRVGAATDLATTMGPLIEPPSGKLLRALTTLDEGESWLVRPERRGERLWTPGVKHGVAPGSFFHLTECFGPVLGIIRVDTLQQAIEVQNAVPFGLTGGLHSLDPGEIATWLDQVQVGNAYVNRHITGAIVGRQPFGGWKASAVGPGAKAGGPHYVAQLGSWIDAPEVPQDDAGWLAWARADDERAWANRFGVEHDPAELGIESNVLRYRPVERLTILVGRGARDREVERVRAAAQRAGVPVSIMDEPQAVAASGENRLFGRVRVIGAAPGLRTAARDDDVGRVTIIDHPVLAAAEREMLTVLKEQVISRTRHRFGHPSS